MRMGKVQSLLRSRGRHLVPVLILAVLSLPLAAYFAPWFYAGTHPLLVSAEVPEGASLEAILDGGWSASLVQSTDGLWVTELPPRKSYTLSLRACAGEIAVTSAIVQDLHARPPIRVLFEWKSEDAGGAHLSATKEPLPICSGLETGRGAFRLAFVSFFFLLMLFYYGCVALWSLAETRPEAKRSFSSWQWGVLLALVFVHLWLIVTATPIFWTTDSIGYATKAFSLYRHWRYDTESVYYELTRAPGAPLLEAAAWKLFGFSLSSVVLLQGLLYCGAALLALDATARISDRRAALLGSPFVLFCPQALYGNRIFASESPFLIFALLMTACMLRTMTAKKSYSRWLWITAATLSAMYAALVRMNGVALLAFPVVFIVRELVQAMRHNGTFRPRVKRCAFWLMPVAGVALTLLVWSWRNYRVRDWFTPSDISGLSAAEATFKSGLLDLRTGAPDDAVYRLYEVKRHKSGYYTEAWALAGEFQKKVAAEGPVDMHAARRVDGMLADFAARSNAACPWQSRVTRFLRNFRWGLFMYRNATFQPFRNETYAFVTEKDNHWADTNQILSDWISPELMLEQKPLGMAQKAWNIVQKAHKGLLIVGILLGFVALALAAQRGWNAVLLPLLTYFGNLLLITWLGVVISRLVLVLEPLLWLGLALAAYPLARELAAGKGSKAER